MRFDWDDANLNHIAEHKVSPEEAEEVFYSDPARLRFALIKGELRRIIVGATATQRYLSLVYVIRHAKVRVVTAFPASEKRIAFYLERRAR